MTAKELQKMSDFFIRELFFGIPKIECRFVRYEKNSTQMGAFHIRANDNLDNSESEELEEILKNAPEYKIRHVQSEERIGFGIDIERDPMWTDPLFKPLLFIEINNRLRKEDLLAVGTLLHELTHYYCWYCGYDHHDGSNDFERELDERGLPSNFDRAFLYGDWQDSFDYSSMQKYLDMFQKSRKTK